MDYQTFRTYRQAKERTKEFMGWNKVRPSLLYFPSDPNATKNGNVWVIRIEDYKYLRIDGQIR